MKKLIIAGIGIIVCVALCAVVWPRNAGVGDLPAELNKPAVAAEIEVRSEEMMKTLISADALAPDAGVIAASAPEKTEMTAEEKTETAPPTALTSNAVSKPATASSEPHNGDVRIVNGEKQIYLLGFGWIKDEGGGGSGTTVGNPGDELTGNKVGIM